MAYKHIDAGYDTTKRRMEIFKDSMERAKIGDTFSDVPVGIGWELKKVTPRIRFVSLVHFPPDPSCMSGRCCVGIAFTPAVGEGDTAEIRAMVEINGDAVEEFDPQKLPSGLGVTGSCYLLEFTEVSTIRIQFRNQAGELSRKSSKYYFAPRSLIMVA